MSTPTQQEFDQVRSKLDAIAQHAKSDPAYLEQIRSDPRGTLQAAGLPDGAIDDVLREENVGDVSGYMACTWTCLLTSNKCGVTIF